MDNPLDADLDVSGDTGSAEDVYSKEEELSHYMASLGFRAKDARSPSNLEYAKTYSDPSGRVGRTVAVIQKDEVGIEPAKVDYFTLTVQIHVRANEAEVMAKAPTFCRQDLLRILTHFDTFDGRHEVETVECSSCGSDTADFVERAGERLCPDCARRKGT